MFLTIEDYKNFISDAELQAITSGNITIRLQAEANAEAKVRSYLERQYDMDYELSQTGAARNPILVEYLIAFVLFNLFGRVAKEKMSVTRRDHYYEAREYFEGLQKDLFFADLKKIDSDTPNTHTVRLGSEPKITHYY